MHFCCQKKTLSMGLGGRLPSRTLCHIEQASFSIAWPLDYVGSESKKEESGIERETEGG
jgi:hypothetical protein